MENRIQAWADRQTHLLPTDEGLRLRLARAMGFGSWEPFAAALARHRQRVQGHFDKVFAAPQAEVESDSQPLSGVWDESMEPEEGPGGAGRRLALMRWPRPTGGCSSFTAAPPAVAWARAVAPDSVS